MAQRNIYVPPLPANAGKRAPDTYGKPSVLQPGTTLPPAPTPALPPQMGLGQLAASLPIRGRPLPAMPLQDVPMVESQWGPALEALRALYGGGR